MKKTVLIDFQKIEHSFVGLGQFCAHLKRYFDTCSSMDLIYWMPNKWQKIAKQLPFLLPACDVYHATHQDSPYMPWSKKTKVVLTIHDLNYLYRDKNQLFKNLYIKKLQKKIDRASVITYISEFTKSEVEKKLNVEGKKTLVIYNGISLPKTSNRPRITANGKFIFTIGNILPKKNFHTLIDFLKELPNEYTIILAGVAKSTYARLIIERVKNEGLSDRFLIIGPITEEEKKWYYENAIAFIFPSLFEGFGLPVAEAMSLGLPLFLSEETSLPEIGGTDAFYFHSFNSKEMSKIFLEGMKSFNKSQKEKLIERSKKFQWKKASEEYLAVYSDLLENK